MSTPNFKDCIAADIRSTFLNPEEFAELRTIVYDGTEYENIPVSIQDISEEDRPRVSAPGSGRSGLDSASGLALATHVLYCAKDDLGGRQPKQGKSLKIRNPGSEFAREYKIAVSGCEMGMLRLELMEVR